MVKQFKQLMSNIKLMDKTLLITTIALFIFGLLNIVTASSREAVIQLDKSIFYYFYRHLAILSLGLMSFIIITTIDTKIYKKLIFSIFIIILILNGALIFKSSATRGANNWYRLGFFNFQPSEFAKPVIIVYLAIIFEKYCKMFRNKKIDHKYYIGIVLFIGLLIPFIVFLQNDLGTATILGTIFFVMFLASPILRSEKLNIINLIIILGVAAGLILFLSKGHILSNAQTSRLDFTNPCSKYTGTGYQVCNAYIAINKGGLKGLGIGNSTQKYSYIPEPHTDMVFAIVAEENGLLRCTLIFIGYVIILTRIIKLSKTAKNMFGQYACLGFATYIFMHILINLGGLFGLIPLTGVPLPFLSYGGSFTLSLMVSLGIVQRINIEKHNNKLI